MSYILVVDSGTTATKLTLFDLAGNSVASSLQEYSLETPNTVSVELAVPKYWEAFKAGTRDVLDQSGANPAEIRVIGISAQGETLINLDQKGQPLRNAIIWMDNRAEKEADVLADHFGHEEAFKITGQVKLVATWPAAKILWLRENQPQVYRDTDKYVLVEDYLIWRLTGELVAEGSLLCSTAYWDITTKDYWPEMLDYLGVSRQQLPQIREPGEIVGTVRPDVAQELGLSPDTLVSTGVLDTVAAAIGAGNIKPGIITQTIGACLGIVETLDQPLFDPESRAPCHYHGIKDTYALVPWCNTGGMFLRWYRDRFCPSEMHVAEVTEQDAYDLLNRQAAHVPPGSEGLVMLPHLAGALAPEFDLKARAIFYGLALKHSKQHVARAIMESIAYMLRKNVDVLEEVTGYRAEEIRAGGGGARSPIWNQINADVTQMDVVTTTNEEPASLGAGIVAGVAAGLYPDLESACDEMVKVKQVFKPEPANREAYERAYQMYLDLYESLAPMFARYS